MLSVHATKRFSAVRTAREEYAQEGYYISRGFLSPAEVDQMLAEIDHMKRDCLKTKGLRPPPFQALFSPDALHHLRESSHACEVFGPSLGNIDTLGHGLHHMPHTTFHALANSAKLEQCLASICPHISRPEIVQTKVIFKPAKTGSRVPTHTDEQYIFTNPISGVALWIALDGASKTNGCVQVVPGSHLAGEYAPGQRFSVTETGGGGGGQIVKWEEQQRPSSGEFKHNFPYSKQDIDRLEWVFAEMRPGDCLLMDVRLLHASQANTSAQQRRALTLHLIDAACEWDDRNWIVRRGE